MYSGIDISGKTNIRNVYLSDIQAIRSLYRNHHPNIIVTEDIGLPLALADYNKRTIGYAYAIFKPSNEAKIYTHFRQEFESEDIKQQLLEYATEVLNAMSNTGKPEYSKLGTYLNRFVDWLNKDQCGNEKS